MEPEYDIWYQMLNCGMRLPASTGSDWFVCSSNRVYVDVGAEFSYGTWLAGLREGRTFITDGLVTGVRTDVGAIMVRALDGTRFVGYVARIESKNATT